MSDDRAGQRRSLADRFLGAAAEPSAPKPVVERQETPRSVRLSALVVAAEAAALAVAAGYLAVRTLTGGADSDRGAWGLVLFAVLGAVLLAACARGLVRVASWARGPVVAVQLLLGAVGLTAAFSYEHPEVGLPLLVPVAVTMYLLATPEARLAFFQRRGD